MLPSSQLFVIQANNDEYSTCSKNLLGHDITMIQSSRSRLSMNLDANLWNSVGFLGNNAMHSLIVLFPFHVGRVFFEPLQPDNTSMHFSIVLSSSRIRGLFFKPPKEAVACDGNSALDIY
ncbi:hypothetical protein Tco_0277173 [Tanacetum coccineum]